jgi:hypothetical protein
MDEKYVWQPMYVFAPFQQLAAQNDSLEVGRNQRGSAGISEIGVVSRFPFWGRMSIYLVELNTAFDTAALRFKFMGFFAGRTLAQGFRAKEIICL